MFRSQDIQVFVIFNYPIIYRICDVMSFSTEDMVHFWISFELQIIKSPNLTFW